MKTEYFEVRLYVTGIKNKERKVKRHSLKLSNVPLFAENRPDESVKSIEEAKVIAKTTMKNIVQGTAHLSFCYTSEDTNTPDMKTSEPFNENNFQIKIEV